LETGVAYEREVVIHNREGLHFRPIMQIVDLLSRYKARVTAHCEDRQADGRSPMELLMLVATQGTKIRFVGDGEDARSAVDAVVKLIESGFRES